MQKFRGLDPRTRLARWGLAAVGLGIVLGTTGPQAADLAARALAAQPGSLPWYLSRLLAFLAYLALAGSVVYGLLLSTGILDAIAHRPITFALHQDLASMGLGLAGMHGALLALDRTIPFTLATLLVPFASPYRPLWVGIGQVGLYVTAVVIGSFYVRRRIGQRTWRMLHYLTFLSFVSATAHGVMSGTDSGTPWAWVIYVGATAAVAFLMTYRIVLSVATRRRGPQSGRAAATRPTARPLPTAGRRSADADAA
jgi:sulfoxide reductase heme-binding subunit YedZ